MPEIANQIVRLKTLPLPDFMEFSLPEGHICLLTDDGTQTSAALAQLLLERGWQVAVLAFPQAIVPAQSSLPAGVSRITLNDMSESHLQQRLAEISADVGPVGAFIHLSPTSNQAGAAKAILKHIFLIAKHLKPSLDEAAQQGRACFLTAARLDGALGLSGDLEFNPVDGGLFGLTKTLNLEWPGVFCRAVDLHPGLTPQDAAQYLLAELHDPNRLLLETGYGNQGRVTLTVEAVRSQTEFGNEEKAAFGNEKNRKSKIQNPKSAVFVISGGAKGITAQCAIEMARQYRCKFILLGRSAIDNVENVEEYSNEAGLKRQIMETLLAKGEKPTPLKVQQVANAVRSKQEIEATLQAIRQAGGQAEYLSVDVTNAAALQAQLPAAVNRLGPVTGVIHGAGVLSDKLIEQKTEDDFEKVYAVKVQGLQTLLQTIPPQQLEHLILFSSAAGFYGNIGQADYALANEILNKTAHLIKRRHPSCRVLSINWGPWDGGMVTSALKKLFAERNIKVIPPESGTRILVDELSRANSNATQTVAGGPLSFSAVAPNAALRSYRIHRALSLEANPFLYDHIIGEHPVLPTVTAIAWMGNACEQLYPGYKMFSCHNYQVLKGIVFDEENASGKFYALDLEEVNKTDNEITFKALIWSNGPKGRPRYHYRAEITLMQKLPQAPLYRAFNLAETQPITKTDLYQNGTLFHGPSFQGVERVLNISPQKITMRCRLPEIPPAQQGQFLVQTFNPFIADGQFQSLVIWARQIYQAGSLPLQARRGEQYRPIPFGETSFVSMEVKESADTKLVADIITHDAEGRVYARVLGAEVTISKQLNQLFDKPKATVRASL
ncbi:MAG TPA: SDR family NAD(P)-dependent oxidoreductase [Anaerolineae bacterium]|nr:SDR family NAD(P)-dependent oxidoreductase [Anaerolineae bacterium]